MNAPPPSPEPQPAEITAKLACRRAEWSGASIASHLTAVALLAGALALRWWPYVSAPVPINDELIYFRAFDQVVRGLSPFDRSGYLSFSLLAHLGGFLVERLGKGPTLALLRSLNLVGVSTLAWCSIAWVPGSLRRRWLVAAVFLVLSPAVAFGVFVANLSLVVSGMMVLALMCWPRRPIIAGLLLGSSVIAKPLAPGAVLALAACRPANRGRAHLVAAGVAALVAGAVALGSPELDRALALDVWPRLDRTVSPHRIGHLLGLAWSPPWISLAIGLVVVLVARRRCHGETRLLALAVVSAIATVPLVWSHTLLSTLPLQVLALGVALERFRHHRRSTTTASATADAVRIRGRSLELTLVILGVLALQLAEGPTGIDDQPALIQWIGTLPPVFAPWCLLAYFLHHTDDEL